MTIASELTLLNNTKTAIADAIEDKGVTVGTIPFSQYPDKIAEISGGGGDIPIEWSQEYYDAVYDAGPGSWVRNPSWLPLPTVTDTESKFVGLHAVWPEANFLALSAGPEPINLLSTGTTTDASTYTTATVSLVSGLVYLFAIENSHGSDASAVSSITGGANLPTFTLQTSTQFNAGLNRVTLFSCQPTVNYSGTLTIAFGGVTQTGALWNISSFGAVDGTTNDGVVQAVVNTGDSTEPFANLSTFGNALNSTYCAIANVGGLPDTGDGLTALGNATVSTPTQRLGVRWRAENATTVKVTATTGAWAVIAVELAQLPTFLVDWGDGETTSYSTIAYKQYDFSDADLGNTNAPVTFTASTSVVNRTAHGYNNGDTISFDSITITTGIVAGQIYYVVNKTADTFQLSATEDGTALTLTNDGSGIILPYKQVVVTVTPETGVTFTKLNLSVRHNQAKLNQYTSGWLDVLISGPNLTSLIVAGPGSAIFHSYLERAQLISTNNITSFFYMFFNCRSLQSVPIWQTGTSGITTTSGMFAGCVSLQTVLLFDTSGVTDMNQMFNNCPKLQTVPLFNTAAVTSMASMFNSCFSLQTVPLFNTANVTSMNEMFSTCRSLQTVPLFNTVKVTSMATMLVNCPSLTSVPLFNTGAVTNMQQMIQGCSALTTVPLFNTANVTNMATMFYECRNLKTIPLFNTVKVINMSQMFNFCFSLEKIPALITTAVNSSSNFNSMFQNCPSLSRIEAKDFNFTFSVASCKLSDVRLKEIFTNLPRVTTSQTLTVTGNYGIGTITSKASLSLTAGSTTISTADTFGVVNGMFVTGIGTAINTDVSVTSDVTLDTLTKTAHGLSNGDKITFSALSTTTGVLTWTIYYVVNKTDNDFQIALTEGGSPIDLTGSNATMTMRYPSFVTNVVTNTSVTISTPLASTGTQTLTFRELDSSEALLKNWAVTF